MPHVVATYRYAAGSDPGWATGATEAPADFAAFHGHYSRLVDPDPAGLSDGYAVTYHDALATAIGAVISSSGSFA